MDSTKNIRTIRMVDVNSRHWISFLWIFLESQSRTSGVRHSAKIHNLFPCHPRVSLSLGDSDARDRSSRHTDVEKEKATGVFLDRFAAAIFSAASPTISRATRAP